MHLSSPVSDWIWLHTMLGWLMTFAQYVCAGAVFDARSWFQLRWSPNVRTISHFNFDFCGRCHCELACHDHRRRCGFAKFVVWFVVLWFVCHWVKLLCLLQKKCQLTLNCSYILTYYFKYVILLSFLHLLTTILFLDTQQSEGKSCSIGTINVRQPSQWHNSNIIPIKLTIRTTALARS